MKISIALSILILVAAAALGWHDHQRLEMIQEQHGRLVAKAAALGSGLDSSRRIKSIRFNKRERESKDLSGKTVVAEFIALAKEFEAVEEKGGFMSDEMEMRLVDHMASLDPAQLKIFIAEFRADQSFKDQTRQELISHSIMTLADNHPQAALTLYAESCDLFKDNTTISEQIVCSSLAKWARDDAMAALVWVRKNGEKFPEFVTDEAKCSLISGAATSEPKLAFKLLGEFGIESDSQVISGIIGAANTPEQRTATLAALRGHLATLTDEETRTGTAHQAITELARKMVERQSFEAASQWLATAKLSPEELQSFASGLDNNNTAGKQGQWLEWLGRTLPAGKSDQEIRNIVRNWTRTDYRAAGKWLAATPAGPTKITAIRSYIEVVSKYNPTTATQWAMTLPPGKEREETLKSIQENSFAK
jgi:hypothetical protein